MRRFLTSSFVLAGLLFAPWSEAHAYDRQITLDLGLGWGVAPALEMAPNHGPFAGFGTTIGIDDTWAVGLQAGWAIHPPLVNEGDDLFQVGVVGVEGLYYIDILEIVPFFGVGIDLLPTVNGETWGLDFAAHARVSLDYVLSREVTIGVDVRPYILLTALNVDPVYLTFAARASFLFDY